MFRPADNPPETEVQLNISVRKAGDVTVVEAANVYNTPKQPLIKRKLVSEVVQELLTAKRDKGRSALYIKDLRLRLERVAKAFPSPLADVSPADIDKFLLALIGSPRSRNTISSTQLHYSWLR